MKLGSGIRFALAAATLLAQLALPLAHGLGVAAQERNAVANAADVVAATSDGSNAAAHDPNLCPSCLALSQARAGVGQTLPAFFFALASPGGDHPLERSVALPRAPELVTAPPRAPPILALAFA
jgi:hypothetical protein